MSDSHSNRRVCSSMSHVQCIALVKQFNLMNSYCLFRMWTNMKPLSLFTDHCVPRYSHLQYKLMQFTTDNASLLHLVSLATIDILWYMTSDVAVWHSHCEYCQANIELGGIYSRQIKYSSKHLLPRLTQSSVQKGRGHNVMVCVHHSASQTQSNYNTSSHLCLLLQTSSCLQ